MSRHSTEQALVLTSRLAGEDNRIVTLLGPQRGVFEAMLYGGRKSRLRSLVSPWHSGTIWLYHDKARGSAKISDFAPAAFRPGLREHLYKTMAATLATELVIKTHAADEAQACWALLCGLLDGMELSDEDGCRTGLLRFLWRYLGLMGVQADCHQCAHCGEPLARDTTDGGNQPAIHYSTQEGGFLCPDCGRQEGPLPGGGFPLGQEAVGYLQATLEDMALARRTALSAAAHHQLRHLLLYLAGSAAGGRLKTLESGLGIL